MDSTANSQSRIKTWPWRSSLAAALLAGAFLYFWILPLFRQRGDFLWGHHRLKDIYIGIPIALAILCTLISLAVPARYRRSFSLRLVTVTVSLLLALAVCDAIYAFVVMDVGRANFWLDQAHISRRYSTGDAELGFVRKPGITWRGYVPELNTTVEYHTDENGFRNSTRQRQADIVFLGDSFTESATTFEEELFVRQVERSTGLSVINLARGAYGPQQELIVLRRYGLGYQPRFVVWQLFEGNDLADAESFVKWKKNPQQVPTFLKDRYFDNSLLNQLLTTTRSKERAGPRVSLRYHDGTSHSANLLYPYEPDQPSAMRLGMDETLSAIEAGQQLCEARGIQLLVVFIPTMARVMQPYIDFNRFEDRRDYLPAKIPGDKDFSDTISEFCGQIGCGFIDTFDAMREASSSDNRRLYIPNDEHLDIRGHEVVGKVITDWIQSRINAKIP